MKKTRLGMLLIILCFTFVGCSDEKTQNGVEVGGEGTIVSTVESTEPAPHEHSYVYTTNSDDTHGVGCSDETCDYAETEACAYDENYVCGKCGYTHEHEITITTNEDGTHLLNCLNCELAESTNCILDEAFACTECGWTHEHEGVYVANEDGTHAVNCKYECCSYSYQEKCAYEQYECQACGGAYPWEQDIKYFDETLYYAQKELNIYKYPDVESEVIGTLSVDEEVYCVGTISVDKKIFRITKDGGCIPDNYNFNANRWDLREAKTSQVIVTYMTLSGDTWSALKTYAVYDSYDAALQDLCGSSWSHIKANWTYNDYKSQGLSFLNSYSEGASGKTVSTRNQSAPYNYSVAGGTISYYFE